MANRDKAKFLKKPPQVTDIVVLSDTEFAVEIFTYKVKGKQIILDRLYRDGIIRLLSDLGYCKRYKGKNTYIFIREEQNILDEVEPWMMKDDLMAKLKAVHKDTQLLEYNGINSKVESAEQHGSVQLSVSILFIILGSLVFPCGGMTGGRRPEGRPPQGMVYIL